MIMLFMILGKRLLLIVLECLDKNFIQNNNKIWRTYGIYIVTHKIGFFMILKGFFFNNLMYLVH